MDSVYGGDSASLIDKECGWGFAILYHFVLYIPRGMHTVREWSTSLLLTKVRLILDVWGYIIDKFRYS